jgi:trans-aconitate methyltransferase
MKKIDFSGVSSRYEKDSVAQSAAATELLRLLDIKKTENVLDLGCGVGHITRKIREMTGGRVVGVDPSSGMIEQAKRNLRGMDIKFEIGSAEEIAYEEEFDVIFCNSAFQWFKNTSLAVKNCYNALRKHGRIGIQAPAKKRYGSTFAEAIGKVKRDTRTKDVFAGFRSPWFFLETAEEYSELFRKEGFNVSFSEIKNMETKHSPEEVFNIFSSGAAAGYLNQDFYDVELSDDYIKSFNDIFKQAFYEQADDRGETRLIFNRIFLVAFKGGKK